MKIVPFFSIKLRKAIVFVKLQIFRPIFSGDLKSHSSLRERDWDTLSSLKEMRLMITVYSELIRLAFATESTIEGCSSSEIKEIEKCIDYPLPFAYVEFLRVMGRQAGKLLIGTDIFFPQILECQQYAEELLAEDPSTTFQLDDKTFVFMVHQGYQFMFFKLDSEATDDRPVYHYIEGGTTPTLAYDSFSSFLLSCIYKNE
jgi:hypothetical protein